MNARLAMNSGVSLAAIGVENWWGGNGRCSWLPAFGSYHESRSVTAVVRGTRFVNSRVAEVKSPCGCGQADQQLGERRHDSRPTLSRRQAKQSISRNRILGHASGLHILQLNFVKAPDLGFSRTRRLPVHCSVGLAPHDESGENSSHKPHLLSTVPEEVVSQAGGKGGFISFYAHRNESSLQDRVESVSPPRSGFQLPSLVWPLGPLILVASVVLPPLYLRKAFGAVLEDSLVTDFVILFFTEAFFFMGASIFLYITHISRQATASAVSLEEQKPASPIYSPGYRLSTRIALAIGVLLPVASFVIAWPWTGPAAAAALAPYTIGLIVQLGFEQITKAKNSPVWPLVPITFQMYRLHQLNRAAQLVAGLLFSLKGVEATAETMAINGSLQSLLFVLQLLGMLCLWSLGSFLTNQLPTKLAQPWIPSLP